MKAHTYYSIRSQGTTHKGNFQTEKEAFESAKQLCINTGKDVSIVYHERDISRLVRKVTIKR